MSERIAPKSPPRRGGVKLRSEVDQLVQRAPQSTQPIVAAWLQWLNDIFGTAMIIAAAEEARQGRLASLLITEGKAIATIKGGARPSTVTIQFPALAASQWDTLIEQMASNSAAEANLLAGQLPTGAMEVAEAAGAPLAPSVNEQPMINCDPPRTEAESERAGVIVALCILERIVAEPRIIFALRGRTIEHVLEQLRDARVMQVQGGAAAHGDPFLSRTMVAAPPLEECLDDFWGSGAMLTELEQLPPAHHAPHALLRRLGPSPLGGKFPLVGLLASVYDVVSESAKRVRDRVEQGDEESHGNNSSQ